MTLCSRNSAVPVSPRQFGYPLSFRGQVCGVHGPPPLFPQRFFPRDASLPSCGSRRARVPALSGTMKALRLPTRASTDTHWFAPVATRPLLVRVRRGAPGRSEVPPGPGSLLVPAAPSPACSRVDREWDLSGLQAILLCLCSVPGPRSSRRALAVSVTPMLPPLEDAKASAKSDFGANPQLRPLLPYASRGRCRTRARLASGRPAGPLPGGVKPTGSL